MTTIQPTQQCITHSCRLTGNCLRYKVVLSKPDTVVHKPDTSIKPCIHYWDEFTGEKYDSNIN